MKAEKPILNRRIFWDVDFDKIDYQKKANFVIERVFERGDVDDIRQVRRFYGDEQVSAILTKAKYMPEVKIYLAAAIFNKNLADFRCYTQTQSIKTLWPF